MDFVKNMMDYSIVLERLLIFADIALYVILII